VISGTAYTGNYAPLVAPSLEGTVTLLDEGGAAAGEAIPLHLAATGNNTFRGSFTATQPGRYRFRTAHDPQSILHFDAVQNDPENSRLGLDDRLLVQMASIAGGRFCREEDLHQLPGWISDRSSRIATYRNVDLYSSTWILALFISLLCGEWLLRRLTRLK